MNFAEAAEFQVYKQAVDEAWDDAREAERYWGAEIAKTRKALAEIKPAYDEAMAKWQPLHDEYVRLVEEYNVVRSMMRPTRKERRLYKKSQPIRLELKKVEELEHAIDSKGKALETVEQDIAREQELLNENEGAHFTRAVTAAFHTVNMARYLGFLVERISEQYGTQNALRNILKVRRENRSKNVSSESDKEILKKAHELYLSIAKVREPKANQEVR